MKNSPFFALSRLDPAVSIVAFLVAIILVVRSRISKRYRAAESELREKLLSTEEEVLVLKQAWTIDPDELQLGRVGTQGVIG